jgi:hypothetical protein
MHISTNRSAERGRAAIYWLLLAIGRTNQPLTNLEPLFFNKPLKRMWFMLLQNGGFGVTLYKELYQIWCFAKLSVVSRSCDYK